MAGKYGVIACMLAFCVLVGSFSAGISGNGGFEPTGLQAGSGASPLWGNTWKIKAPMPGGGRSHVAAAAGIDGVIYVFGGSDASVKLSRVEAYNPSSDTWQGCKPMPTARMWLGAATVGGSIYTIGGEDSAIMNTTEVYDVVTGNWTNAAPMPTARSGLGLAVDNDIIFAIGGIDGSGAGRKTVEAYKPGNNTWWNVRDMNSPRRGVTVAKLNGAIYAIGGQTSYGNAPMTSVEAYSPVNNTWWYVKPLPLARVCAGAAVVNETLYVIGGRTTLSGGDTNKVHAYSPANNTWWEVASMSYVRMAPGAATVNNRIYSIGGYTVGSIYDKNEEYSPATQLGCVSWWRLDEGSGSNAFDSVDSNNGAITGATYCSGVSGTGLNFDGTSDYVSVPSSQGLRIQGTKLSLEAWIMPAHSAKAMPIIDKRSNYFNGWCLWTGDASHPGKMTMAIGDGSSNHQVFGTTSLIAGKVYHVVGTYDGSAIRIYVNGLLEGSTPTGISLYTNSAPLYIGHDQPNSYYYDGMIDEVRVYNWTLSPYQIIEHYNTEHSKALSASVTSTPMTVPSGGNANVTVHVTNSTGSIPGASVSMDAAGGSFVPVSGTTNTSGGFVTVYTAPVVTAPQIIRINATVQVSPWTAKSYVDIMVVPSGPSAPSEPRNLAATPGDTQVTLDWTAPLYDGGSPVTNYRVYRGMVSGAATFLTEIGNVLMHTDTGLTNGVKYYYNITAKNIIGEGATSSEVSATPASGPSVPSAPQNLAASAAGTTITLTWQAPTSDGGSAITNYEIYRGTTSGGETKLTEVGVVLTFDDTGLTPGSTYYYKVSAKNSIGEGPNSNEASATLSGGWDPPSEPQKLSAIGGNAVVELTWDPPSFNGDGPITNYEIYRGTSSGSETWFLETGNTVYYNDTNVTNGVSYYYKVSAKNWPGKLGEGPKSNEASATPHVPSPGWFTGKVINMRTFDGLPGATVKVNETGDTDTTNTTGYYNITLPAGVYNLTISKTGYITEYGQNVDVWEASESYHTYFLSPPKGALAGKVTDKATGKPIQYASVTPTGYFIGAITDANGNYNITDMYVGDYIVNVSWIFYKNASKPVTILEGQTIVLNFELEGEDILTKAMILGVVTDYKTGNPISGVLVKAGSVSATTSPYGNYNLTVEPGSVTIKFSKAGYNDVSTTQTLNAGDIATLNVKMVPASGGGGGFDMLWLVLIILIVVVVIVVVAVATRKKKQPPATAGPAAPYYPYQHPSPGTQEQAQMPAPPPPIAVPIPLKETLATGQLSIIEQKILDMIKEHPGADPRWLARVLDLRIDNLQTHIRGLTNAGYITVLQSSDKDDLGYYIKGTEPESVLASQSKGE